MNKKTYKDICGIIEIASNSVKMGVFQKKKGGVVCIDKLDYPVTFGHEVYNKGTLSFESLNELSAILSRFSSVLDTYGAGAVRLISSSLMRDCENRALIADRIKTQNGFDLEVLSEDREKSLIYNQIINELGDKYKNDKVLIAFVGSGSIGVAIAESGKVVFSSNLPFGSLKLHDLMGSLHNEMSDYHIAIEEYLHSIFSKVDFEDMEYSSLVLTGTEIGFISDHCANIKRDNMNILSSEGISGLYHSVRSSTPENIAVKYDIDDEKAGVVYTALSIYNEMIKLTGKKASIISPDTDLHKAIAEMTLYTDKNKSFNNFIYDSSVLTAMRISAKFGCNPVHYKATKDNIINIFGKLKKIHGLSQDKLKVLEVASILHSCGQYINIRQRTTCAFDMIKDMDIFGMSRDEIAEVAFISGYTELPISGESDLNLVAINEDRRIELAKMIAMFRIANALDKSQKGKILIEKINFVGEDLVIRVQAKENAVLEKWAFDESAGYFADVFGIKPILTIKTLY